MTQKDRVKLGEERRRVIGEERRKEHERTNES